MYINILYIEFHKGICHYQVTQLYLLPKVKFGVWTLSAGESHADTLSFKY